MNFYCYYSIFNSRNQEGGNMLENIMVQDYIDYVVEYDEDYEKDDIAYEDKVSERMSAE